MTIRGAGAVGRRRPRATSSLPRVILILQDRRERSATMMRSALGARRAARRGAARRSATRRRQVKEIDLSPNSRDRRHWRRVIIAPHTGRMGEEGRTPRPQCDPGKHSATVNSYARFFYTFFFPPKRIECVEESPVGNRSFHVGQSSERKRTRARCYIRAQEDARGFSLARVNENCVGKIQRV